MSIDCRAYIAGVAGDVLPAVNAMKFRNPE
jgi:hypothetical protein